MDTIKELFYGNIHPFERDVPKDGEGDNLNQLIIRHIKRLPISLITMSLLMKKLRCDFETLKRSPVFSFVFITGQLSHSLP